MFNKLLKSTLLLFLITLTLVYSTCLLIDTDAWRHLRMGAETVKNKTVFFEDRFAYTQILPVNHNPSWLFDVFLYLSYSVGGIKGMEAFKCAIILVTLLLLFYISFKRLPYLAAISLTLFVIITIHSRWAERPQIVTVLFLLAYLFILDRYKYEGKDILWCLPILQIIWTNMHIYFVLGAAITSLYLVSETVTAFIPFSFALFSGTSKIRGRRYKKLFLISLASLFACLVNPYSWQWVASFPGLIQGIFIERSTALSRYIGELQPLSYVPANEMFPFKGLFAICLFSILLNRKKVSVQHLILFIIAIYAGLGSIKNIDISGIIMGYLALLNLSCRFRSDEGLQQHFKKPQVVFSFVLLSVIGWLAYTTATRSIFTKEGADLKYGFFASEARFPVKAADFIEANNIKGNMFNEHSMGDYLLWRFFPERPVFMDGRGLSDDLLHYYMDVFRYRKTFEDLKTRYNINYFLLPHEREDVKRMTRLLYNSEDFKLVYLDDVAVVFLKDTPENKPIIEKYATDLSKQSGPEPRAQSPEPFFIKPYPYAFINRGRLYNFLGFDDTAIQEFNAALAINPGLFYIRNELGIIYRQKKMPDEAIAQYKEALKTNPRYYEAVFNLALAYEDKGLKKAAMKEYEKIPVSTGALYADARKNMGIIYYNAAMYTKAEEMVKKALSIAPKDAVLHFNLGSIYAATGRLNAAKRRMIDALKIDPELKNAIDGLKQIESSIEESKKDVK